jgi:hypothetical protein
MIRNQYVEVLVAGPDQGYPVVKYVEVSSQEINPERYAETQLASQGYIILASRRFVQTGM